MAAVFVNASGPGYFGTFPMHDGNRARDLLDEFGLGDFPHSRFANLEAGWQPPPGYFCLGVYPRGLLACGLDELHGGVERGTPGPFVSACLAKFPRAETALVEVSGTTGYAAYALHAEGRWLRAFAADEQRGVVLDRGALTPEELARLGPSADAPARARQGEALAFALASRALGVALDAFEAERLSVELIAMRGRGGALGRLWRLLGRHD